MSAAIRYPAKIAARAREHHEAGWSQKQIVGFIEEEFGVRPADKTIWTWVHPERAARFAAAKRAENFRRGERHRRFPRLTEEYRQARMIALHEAGMSYIAIAIASRVLWGVPLTEDQVRYVFQKLAKSGVTT